MRKLFNLYVALLLLVAGTAMNSNAQNAPGQTSALGSQLSAANSPAVTTAAPATQALLNALASLPEADTLIYINPQRILNEVVPKFMAAKDVEAMRKAFEEVKTNAGIDPAKVDYMVIAVRFKKPTAELSFQPPEFLVVTGGDFSAESLMVLARIASAGKLRDEQYGDKAIGLMTIDPVAKEAEKNPLLKAFSELGVASLNANTIASGSPEYLRAAIDAAGGKDRINPATLNSLVRDTNVLVSLAGSPWHSFARSFGMMGTETTPRAPRCESNMGDFYTALTMDASNFIVRGTMNADNPDTAWIITNLLAGLLKQATSSVPDPSAQSLFKSLAITAEGDEVLLSADFPQKMVIDMFQQQMKPKAVEASSTPKKKPAVKGRRVKRRP